MSDEMKTMLFEHATNAFLDWWNEKSFGGSGHTHEIMIERYDASYRAYMCVISDFGLIPEFNAYFDSTSRYVLEPCFT